MPGRRERRAHRRDRALVRAIAVHDLELGPIDERNSRSGDSARACDPALDLVGHDVNPEPPLALERIAHDRILEDEPRVHRVGVEGVPHRSRAEQRVAAIELAGKRIARLLGAARVRTVACRLDRNALRRRLRKTVSRRGVRRQRANRHIRLPAKERRKRIAHRRQPVRWNLRQSEIILLPQPATRHVVDFDVQSRRGEAGPHHEICPRLRERREVDVFPTRPPYVIQRRTVENERLHAIAVVEVALDDYARRVTSRRIDLQHDHRRRNLGGLLRLGPGHYWRIAILARHRGSQREERHHSDEELATSIGHERLNLIRSGNHTPPPLCRFGAGQRKAAEEIPPRLYAIGLLVNE